MARFGRVTESRPEDQQGGHGYPVSVGKAEVAVDFCADAKGNGEADGIGQSTGRGIALKHGTGGLLNVLAQGLVLVAYMAS
jgi:hypothetical protein